RCDVPGFNVAAGKLLEQVVVRQDPVELLRARGEPGLGLEEITVVHALDVDAAQVGRQRLLRERQQQQAAKYAAHRRHGDQLSNNRLSLSSILSSFSVCCSSAPSSCCSSVPSSLSISRPSSSLRFSSTTLCASAFSMPSMSGRMLGDARAPLILSGMTACVKSSSSAWLAAPTNSGRSSTRA